MCQVRRVFPAALEPPAQLEHLDFRAFLATQAVLDILVYLGIPGVRVIRDFWVLLVQLAQLAQQVSAFFVAICWHTVNVIFILLNKALPAK